MTALVIDDNFTRSDTSTGSAGSTTGIGNGWIDVTGGIWNISSNKAVLTPGANTFKNSLLLRPSGEASTSGHCVVDCPGISGISQIAIVAAATTTAFYMAFASNTVIELYLVKGATATLIQSVTIPTMSGGTPVQVDLTWSQSGGTTTLTATSINLSTGKINGVAAGTDTDVTLQVALRPGLDGNAAAQSFTRARTYTGIPVVVPVNDSNLSWSAGWFMNGSTYAQTVSSGQDVYATFTGASSIRISCDLSPLTGGSVSTSAYPQLIFSIDGGPWTTEASIASSTVVNVQLASGTTHSIRAFIQEIGSADRWSGPANCVRITGIQLDAGSTTTLVGAPTGGDEYHYGDSIGEGTRVRGIGVSLFDHDARESPPYLWSAAQGTRANNLSFGSQGVTVAGASNVPAFTSSYNKFDSGHSSLSGGKFIRQPVAIQIWQGENDYLNSVSSATVQAAVTSMCANLRACCTSSAVPIVWHVPFSGGQRTAITAGVAAAADPYCFVIDGGTTDQTGLTSLTLTNPSMQSADGVHPYGRVGAYLVGHHLALYQLATDTASVSANASNIKSGTTILGVTGTLSSGDEMPREDYPGTLTALTNLTDLLAVTPTKVPTKGGVRVLAAAGNTTPINCTVVIRTTPNASEDTVKSFQLAAGIEKKVDLGSVGMVSKITVRAQKVDETKSASATAEVSV